jgi:hypothetical protein
MNSGSTNNTKPPTVGNQRASSASSNIDFGVGQVNILAEKRNRQQFSNHMIMP